MFPRLLAPLCLLMVQACFRHTNALVATCLSPLESALLGDRLKKIEDAVLDGFRSKTLLDYNTFIFPGAGGVDPLVEELQTKLPQSLIVDWKEHRGSIATAAYDGEAVGEAIASLIMSEEKLKEQSTNKSYLHFVGISVGGFCANAAARLAYQNFAGHEGVEVRLTLLDPFCGRGLFGNTYGRDNFGKDATTAVHILNTDDPVPTTNDPLPNCFCLDVTEAPQRESFVLLPGDSMHSWPVAYFARHYEEPSYPLQRGKVVRI